MVDERRRRLSTATAKLRETRPPLEIKAGPTETLLLGERREISALSYDLIGSTQLLVAGDLEAFGGVISQFQGSALRAIRSKSGFILDPLGDDGGMAFFGYPDPIEGSAEAAIRAALDLVAACRGLHMGKDTLKVRVGIATAEVVIDRSRAGTGTAIVGLAPTLAARLQAVASTNRIWICDRTRQLAGRSFTFQSLGQIELKGLGSDRLVWEVRRETSKPRFLAESRADTRHVGREAELDRILDLWREAEQGHGRLLIIEGEAGIGKSRLVFEFLKTAREARRRAIILQCSSHGGDVALGPLIDLIRAQQPRHSRSGNEPTKADVMRALDRAGVQTQDVVDTIAFAIGATSDEKSAGETRAVADAHLRFMAAVRHCIKVWGSDGPLIIAIEDVHWIDPSSRRVIESIAEDINTMPVVLILTSRDALRWANKIDCTRLRLRPLRAEDAARMASGIQADHGGPKLSANAVQRLLVRAKGVPLYIQEMLHAAEAGLAGYAPTPSATAPPFSFENLIATRLGTLGAAKHVAQAAAVLGAEFDVAMLTALLPATPQRELVSLLGALVKANVLKVRRSSGNPRWAFRHGLFQEVLFKSILRTDRIGLHRRIFMAARAETGAELAIGPAALARHAEGADLPEEAALAYITAAKRSFARSAAVEARSLLRQAQAMREQVQDPETRDRLFLAVAAALGPLLISLEGNRSVEARGLYDQAVAIAQTRGKEEQGGLFPIYWGWWFTGADFGIQLTRAETVKAEMSHATSLEARLQANHCLWAIEFNVGRHSQCLSAVEQGLIHYEAAGAHESLTLYGGHDPRVCGLGQAGLSMWFRGHPARAMALVGAALAHAHAIKHVGSLAHALDIAAMLHRYQEDLRSLRSITAQMRRLARTHELPSLAAKALIFDGWRLAKRGSPKRGQVFADAGYSIQCDIGTREDFPVYAGMRAEILAIQNERQNALDTIDEALEEVERSKHLYWAAELYRYRALLLSELGRSLDEARTALRRALRIAREQDSKTLFLRAYETARSVDAWSALTDEFGPVLASLLQRVEGDGESADFCAFLDRARTEATSRQPVANPA